MKLRLAVAQFRVPLANRDANAGVIQRFLERNLTETVDLLVLPEYAFGFPEDRDLPGHEKRVKSLSRTLSTEFCTTLVAGTSLQSNRGKLRNRSVVWGDGGERLGHCDKRRPLRDEPGDTAWMGTVQSGRRKCVIERSGWKLGVTVCADLWDGEWVQALVRDGVDVLAVPTKTGVDGPRFTGYGRRMWLTMATARAKEHVIALATADQTQGRVRPGLYACGASGIIDPMTRELTPGQPDIPSTPEAAAESVLVRTVDLGQIRAYREERGRRGFPVGQ